MSSNSFDPRKPSVVRPGSSDSEKLAAIPGDVDFGNDMPFTDVRLGNGMEEAEQWLKRRPSSRDVWFSQFLNQAPSTQPLYPDPSEVPNGMYNPYYPNGNFDGYAGQQISSLDVLQPALNGQPPVDPVLFGGPTETLIENPRVRTNSGNLIGVKMRPDGILVHPYNSRVLHADELHYNNDHPIPPVPQPYTAPHSACGPSTQAPPPAGSTTDTDFGQSTTITTDPGFSSDSDYDPSSSRRTRLRSTKRRKTSHYRIEKPRSRREPLYQVEAPVADKEKPWVRINSATRGNTRTGKTNHYGEGPYTTTPHPLGPHPSWTAQDGTTFAYNTWGELAGVSWKAKQLLHFLYDHPYHTRAGAPNPQQKLILWIQKMPGDSAKRVNTQHGLKCRIHECPAGIYKGRTINTGHYRVAFDEQWSTHGEARNPMHVAGYAHLYCMERFFDFRQLCTDLDVRADDRELTGEPTGEWTAGLNPGSEEYKMVTSFIAHARTGRHAHLWSRYPPHNPARPLARKLPHAATLTHALVDRKAAATGNSKMRMMEARGRSETQFFVNMGDLQRQVDAQQERNSARNEAKRGRRTLKRKMEVLEESEEEDEGVGVGGTR